MDNQGQKAEHYIAKRDGFTNFWDPRAVDRIDRLLEMSLKADFNFTVRDNYGRTPLHFAASNCREPLLRIFLSKLSVAEGFDINVADDDGWTPLMWAAKGGNDLGLFDVAKAKLLIEEYGADVRTCSGHWSPLKLAHLCYVDHWSYLDGHIVDVVKFLSAEESRVDEDSGGIQSLEPMGPDFHPNRVYEYRLNCIGCDLVCHLVKLLTNL